MKQEMIEVMRPRLPNADALRPYLEEIDSNGWYSNFGPLQRRLERRLAGHFQLQENSAACVGNCTAGLMLALMATCRMRGGFCVMPSFTFVASAHAVLAAGLIPLFIDVEPDSWAVSPEKVMAAVDTAPGDVAAVMAVEPFGMPIDIAVWDDFADRHDLPVVIDAAAGFDSLVPGRAPAVVSLHATKVLAAGEGGVVLSRDTALVRSIAARTNFGFVGERRADVAGFNGKLSEYSAAVALASLDRWSETRAAYSELTQYYCRAFSAVDGLALSPGFGDDWVSSTCNISFDEPVAADAMARLREAGIDSRQWWGKGCHSEKAFKEFPRTELRVTDDLGQRVVGLPFHPGLDSAEIHRIADAVGDILRNAD